MIKRLISVVVLCLGWPLAGSANDYATGERLYTAGDFAGAKAVFAHLREQGHAGAEFMTGIMLLNGQGFARDLRIAAVWFYRAAQKGDAGAQLVFGSQRLYGQGIRPDVEDAYLWLTLAARTENPAIAHQAKVFLAEATSRMSAREVAEAEKAARDWRPRRAGFSSRL
ncbi:MAG: sel1 repeat family protein [Alphaproteobacteria bacterium]|nr:sel1 repeat family protein [Alphaproteobacteria bacterium]